MNKILKYANTAVLCLLLLNISAPTGALLEPLSLTYDEETERFSFYRKVRFLPFEGNWYTEVTVHRTGHQCNASGTAHYEPGLRHVTFPAGARLVECMREPGPKTVYNRWQALVFGFLPMRSTSHTENM